MAKRAPKQKVSEATVTLGDVVHPEFVDAQVKIMKLPIQATHAYALKKIFKKVNDEVTTYNEARQEMMKKYCELDAAGNVKINKNSTVSFKTPKDQGDFVKEEAELKKNEITVGTFPVRHFINDDFLIEPGTLLALEPILDETGM